MLGSLRKLSVLGPSVAVVALVAFFSYGLAVGKKAGNVESVMGKKLTFERGDEEGELKAKDDLFFKDWIMTGKKTQAKLLFSPYEKSKIDLFLHESSKFHVDKQMIRKNGTRDWITRLVEGLIQATAKGLGFKKRFMIFTPNAVIGVRGSELWVGILEQEDQMLVYATLKKGANVFLVPYGKDGEPDFKRLKVLPAEEEFTTYVISSNGRIAAILPYKADLKLLKTLFPAAGIVEEIFPFEPPAEQPDIHKKLQKIREHQFEEERVIQQRQEGEVVP